MNIEIICLLVMPINSLVALELFLVVKFHSAIQNISSTSLEKLQYFSILKLMLNWLHVFCRSTFIFRKQTMA